MFTAIKQFLASGSRFADRLFHRRHNLTLPPPQDEEANNAPDAAAHPQPAISSNGPDPLKAVTYMGSLSLGIFTQFGLPAEQDNEHHKCFGVLCFDILIFCLALWVIFFLSLAFLNRRHIRDSPLYFASYLVGIFFSLVAFSKLFGPKLFRNWGPLSVNLGIPIGYMLGALLSSIVSLCASSRAASRDTELRSLDRNRDSYS